MQRLITFSKYRNIGLDKNEYLYLNNSFKKGEMGNLIILIGANNSGKSNVLDGIKQVCNKTQLSPRDITNLVFDDEYRKPKVSLVLKDEKYTFEFSTTINGQSQWKVITKEKEFARPSSEIIKKCLTTIVNLCRSQSFGVGPEMTDLINKIKQNAINDDELYTKAMKAITIFNSQTNSYYGYRGIWNAARTNNELIAHWESEKGSVDSKITNFLSSKYDIQNPIPTVIDYVENKLTSNDLFTDDIDYLNEHRFFKSLFKAVGIDPKTIQNAYAQFRDNNNSAILNKLKKQLQPKVEKLNDQFNKLYFASKDQYKFTLDFESNRISFGMARGKDEDAIVLEYQSTGFRWFFDLFFNFLSVNNLKPGDIVIMDEPATNLHPQGQKELRSFIKEFAIKNDILFIIATHSPFLIDPDNFDELKVISMENNRSKIDNNFSAVNMDDPDSLLPIKDALTIKQNVLYDLDTEVVWVEGITDYNYLTMFKRLFKKKNIAFLPFNGVGNNSAQTKSILERLVAIKFHKKSLLVDADKAGKDMYGQAKDANFDSVISISEIMIGDKPAMMIEDLFTAEDKKKYPVIKEKDGCGISIMKNHCKLSDFSKETVEHFKQLFELIED